jgi:hypothetical protein
MFSIGFCFSKLIFYTIRISKCVTTVDKNKLLDTRTLRLRNNFANIIFVDNYYYYNYNYYYYYYYIILYIKCVKCMA